MKRIIMVLGVMALLAVAVVSMGVANGAPGGRELIMDALVVEISPGVSTTLDKGQTEYVELDLFEEGDAGGVAIGEGDGMSMATEPMGVAGTMGLFVYEIFGEGEIPVSSGPGLAGDPGGRTGAIIGGTGLYRGTTGEHNVTFIEGVITINFKFGSRGRP